MSQNHNKKRKRTKHNKKSEEPEHQFASKQSSSLHCDYKRYLVSWNHQIQKSKIINFQSSRAAWSSYIWFIAHKKRKNKNTNLLEILSIVIVEAFCTFRTTKSEKYKVIWQIVGQVETIAYHHPARSILLHIYFHFHSIHLM